MASALVILVFFAIIALLLGGGWATEQRRRRTDEDPSLVQHAAADAGRVGSVAAVGPHDAASVGTPTLLDALDHRSAR